MNFYRAQQDARRKTLQLALLFGAAVITLLVLTNLLVAGASLWITASGSNANGQMPGLANLAQIPLEQWFVVSAAVFGIIGLACAYKYFQIRSGGRAVAESLGGIRLLQATQDHKQKRLLNVVEEMALAAGIAVPPVYLIPEPSINAFAAGLGTDDAVIGINQGTLDLLNREELQGVVAHEFSHIMNGDTRINLKLIVMLHGILFIGLVGYMLLRSTGHSRGSRSGGNSAAPLLLLGGGLMVIGYGGTFFGNLIKAAVSRQREYLADGSAVQYTRNPQGIGGALKKIGGYVAGSQMQHANAKEASHMFFGNAMGRQLAGFMSTHPPLPQRIQAIDPNWDGNFTPVDERLVGTVSDTDNPLASAFSGSSANFDVLEDRVAQVNDMMGNPSERSHDNAVLIVQTTQQQLLDAAHNPLSAKALVYAMLVSVDQAQRQRQLRLLADNEHHAVGQSTTELHNRLSEVDDLHKLTLLQAAMPALKEMSRSQYQRFMRMVAVLIKADRQIELFEWVMHRVLVKELRPHFERVKAHPWRYQDVGQCTAATHKLLSTLARQGSNSPDQQQQAFAAGLVAGNLAGAIKPDVDLTDDPNFEQLSNALKQLSQLAPLAKPKLMKACAATVLADAHVTIAEGALLQGVAATLDCPLPPDIYQHIQPNL